ncbi:hypothetical protein ACHHYP_00246 [Achlya hypogyna]|uniref:Transmembrane protein n=1 Tax=Achlya hypogyna TaxID=1202772 RepID=A0A1V9ZB51_ACHHY|nr:hypothetical protein ACHHYP_00246 [Achlya hypogyna]
MAMAPQTPKTEYAALTDSKDTEPVKATVGYKPVFLGLSARDLMLIPALLVLFYTIVGSYFTLLLHAVVQTQNTDAALWMFFAIFAVAVTMLVFFLNVQASKSALVETQA